MAGVPRRLEEVERAGRVDLEVPAGVGDGCGDGCLSSQMVNHLRVRDRPCTDAGINDAPDDELPAVAMAGAQPADVLVGAAAREVIEDCDAVSAG